MFNTQFRFSAGKTSRWLALCVACLSVGLNAPSLRAAAMPEILVSSGLRPADVSETDRSITVLERDRIEQSAVQHFEELIRLVPNFNWSGEGARARYFQIRGVGELEQYEGAPNASVGFLLDEIDFSGIGGASTLFDLQRIEVLRGPQGTRYGANALAGLVYLESVEPSEELRGRLQLTAGNDDSRAIAGAVGGPVAGTDARLQYRVAAQQYVSDGFRDNLFLGRDDTYERDEVTVRGKLRLLMGDRWQADLSSVYIDLDNGYDGFSVDNGFETFSDRPGEDRQRSAGGSLRIDGRSPGGVIDLVSITTFLDSDIEFSFDADWGNDEFWGSDRFGNSVYDYFSATDRDRQTFTQEFRLVSGESGRLFGDSTAWVAGIYFRSEDEVNRTVNFARDDFTPPCFPGDELVNDPVSRCRSEFGSEYTADSVALFGQLDVALSERWALAFGLRGERRDADYWDSNTLAFSPRDDLWGGNITLSHDFDEATRLYARIARGYRAGGFNINPFIPAGQVRFDDEYLFNYELGLRAAAPDQRWSYDVAVFWQNRRDAQVKIPLQDALGNPIAFTFLTENAERATSLGLELQGQIAVTESLTLRGVLGLLDAEVDRFTYDPSLEGRDVAHAPSYNYALGARVTRPAGWFLDFEFSVQDDYFFDFSHDQRSEPYELVNLSAGREWGRFKVTFWARNLFDEKYAVRGFFFGNEPPAFEPRQYVRLGDRRHVGVTVAYNY